MFHHLRRLLLIGSALGCVLGTARAEIETVTVTAEKTEQNILNVGINVTSLSAEDVRTGRIETAMDLQNRIPNVDIKTNIPGAQQIITVRGVGLDDFSSTNNSSVGVYVDDVFLASFAEMDFNFFDLGRIEVLKGPQGTLYGRNSTAGAINVISATPSFDGFSGNVSAGYGNFETFDADAMLNVPLSDSFALRFSGKTVQQGEGYWFSRLLNRDLGRRDVLLGRAQALWQVSPSFTALLKLEGEHTRSEIGVGKFFGTINIAAPPPGCPDFADPSHCINVHGYTDTTSDPFEGDWNHLAPYDVDNFNTTLRLDGDLGWATLTSVTGYINFKRRFYIDADASPTIDAEFDQNDAVLQMSQELRLAGETGGVNWLVGGYLSSDRVHSYTPGSLADFFAVAFGFPADVFIESEQHTRSAALFGKADWPLSDTLTLSTGVRLTYEDRNYTGGSAFTFSGTPIPYFGGFFDTHLPLTTIIDRNVSWRGALNYKPDGDTLVYLSVSRGTKSGGFFNGITTNVAQLLPYKPETLTDYEAGVKAELADNTLLIDASVFYYDYQDLQAQTLTPVGPISVFKLGNIGHAQIYGLDLDATWAPDAHWTIRGALGLLHTRLGAFATPGGPVPAGNRLPDAPDVSLAGEVRYQTEVFDGHIGALQLQGHYAGDAFKEALNTPYLFSDSHWVFDARASLASADTGWEVALWAKNLFDEEYVAQATDDGIGTGYRVFAPPRTFGVTLTYSFD